MGKNVNNPNQIGGTRIRLTDPKDLALFNWWREFVEKPWVRAIAPNKEKVVKSLLWHLKRLDDDKHQSDIEAILGDGVSQNGAPMLDEVLEQLSWGEHAFHGKRYSWALLEFQQLDAQTTSRRMPSLERFAQFRQAHCWMDLAGLLRRKALRAQSADEMATEHFRAALECLVEAARLGDRLVTKTTHRILRYNLACTYSLMAQFTVEAALVGHAPLTTVRAAAGVRGAGKPSDEELDRKCAALWQELGRDWRDLVPHEIRDEAAVRARAAMKWLQETSNEKGMPRLGGFIYEFAESDPDLLLIRHDKELGSEFQGWLETGRSDSDANLLGAAQDLIKDAKARHQRGGQRQVAETKPGMERGAAPVGSAPPEAL